MSKLLEAVRNSPLVTKRKVSGGYQVLDTEKKDPFIKGITFKAQYYASAEVEDNHNSPAVQEAVWEVCEGSRRDPNRSFRKVVLTVKAQSLVVTDVATKVTDTYPIFLVAYCGGHGEVQDCFFFIHKTKLEKKMKVEVFRCSSAAKVKAITLTIAKAFNISYKAWMMKKKKNEQAAAAAKRAASTAGSIGSESPSLQRKAAKPQGKSNLTKMAPGVATGGVYTPPAPRKPPSGSSEATGRPRRGSFGDDPAPKNPAVVRAMVHNEKTGSTHNVTLTDDFDLEFQQLAESRTQPEVLRTSFVEDETDAFNLDSIIAHIDDDPN
jgi:hypothetical protein